MIYAVCAGLSSLQSVTKKQQQLKTAKLSAGWQNVTFFASFKVFQREFTETIWYMWLKFSEITEIVMLFQYSEISFY